MREIGLAQVDIEGYPSDGKTFFWAFLGQVSLARRGRFVAYEALNFVNGRRTLLEIRDAVSAEYGPVPADEVEQYFRFLERLEVVTLVPASP